ncbi:hypothetical protein Bca52824_067641 [Brassica carinata]|uniref:Uncharacterized protein n=1 Tax=Brassica carinata TaxID=52824 RepID=A0A8X7QMZ8_BRACI|nr:hypothetical protein Bca52824_067641 [Brassica carinata]
MVTKEDREVWPVLYRFPEGESAADVFDRVSSFLESLWRDIDMNRMHINPSHELNFVIVSHGLTSRVFLMKWFKWTVEQFEALNNPGNSEIRVMELGQGGDYSLAIHHTEEELERWEVGGRKKHYNLTSDLETNMFIALVIDVIRILGIIFI